MQELSVRFYAPLSFDQKLFQCICSKLAPRCEGKLTKIKLFIPQEEVAVFVPHY